MTLRLSAILIPLGAVALLSAGPTEGAAQAIKGTVTDSATNQPLSGVTVTVLGSDARATTGSDGTYRLSPVSAGAHVVRAEASGYASAEHNVVVSGSGDATADFQLASRSGGGSGSVLRRVASPATDIRRPAGRPAATRR